MQAASPSQHTPLRSVEQSPAEHEERIFLPSELRTKPVVECGEPLAAIQNQIPGLECRHILPETADDLRSELMLCRVGVSERLREAAMSIERCAAQGLLPEGARLIVGYAYRAPEVQADYFEKVKKHVLKANPKLTGKELEAEASKLVNPKDVAGHPAGAALDVTIVDKHGKELDMGTPFLPFKDDELVAHGAFIPVFAYKRSNPEIHERRLVLREAMTSAGFAPFAGEWWHFSYGDRDWAYYYDKPRAIYGEVSSAQAKARIEELGKGEGAPNVESRV